MPALPRAPPLPRQQPRQFSSRLLRTAPTLVVVEGPSDRAAVLAALPAAAVTTTNGTPPRVPTQAYAVPPAALQRLVQLAAGREVVCLADPDPGGRCMRGALHTLLGPDLRHAFVPGAACSGAAGEVGVEHARPAAILAALAAARRRDDSRAEFSRADLLAWGLAGTQGEPPPTGFSQGVAARRDAVGCALGFGACDGRMFLKYANAYGFTRAEVEAAVATLPT